MMTRPISRLPLLVVLACGNTSPPSHPPGPPPGPATLGFTAVPLPGAAAPASLDYLAYDGAHGRVWVPVGNTGSVDVYDIGTGTFTRVDGFPTEEREHDGRKRTVGPSAVAIGDGFAYVNNRATHEICPVDTARLALGKCLALSSPGDGVAYVTATKEVWVTTPRSQSIAVLDASHPDTLQPKATLKLEGETEGYAIDGTRGLFFTNLEDKNRTLVIDLKAHETMASWALDCGSDGPRGVAADADRGFVFVACTDHLLVLDGSHDGAKVATLDTGLGVDNIDWLGSKRLLFVAAGKAARLTVAHVDDRGQPTVVAVGTSVEGARNGVVDASGNAYVADPANARLLVFPHVP